MLISWACVAAATPLHSIKDRIRSICPNGVIQTDGVAFGDLNADTLQDAAAIVSCKAPTELEIFLFQGTPSGQFQLMDRTQVWGAHERRWDGVKIKNGVLIYSQGCAAACNDNWNSDFKFQMRDGARVRIGEDHFGTGNPGESKNGILEYGYSYGQSINYIAQEVLYWRHTKNRRVEKRLRFKQKPLRFSEFSFDDETPRAPELTGFIDDNFELKLLR